MNKATDDDDGAGDWGPAMPLLLTKGQAADWAQVSVSKVQDWLDEPGFPAIRTSRQVRIHARLYEEWLAAKASGGGV